MYKSMYVACVISLPFFFQISACQDATTNSTETSDESTTGITNEPEARNSSDATTDEAETVPTTTDNERAVTMEYNQATDPPSTDQESSTTSTSSTSAQPSTTSKNRGIAVYPSVLVLALPVCFFSMKLVGAV